jgi:hypothetical protein
VVENRAQVVIGRIELGPTLTPVSTPPRRTNKRADAKLHRLLLAARVYRDQRSQKALDELIDAAKDIE